MTIVFTILLGVVSFLVLGFAITRTYLKFRRLKQEGIKSKGIITDFKTIKNRNSERYMPMVQFKTYLGIEISGNPVRDYSKKEYLSAPKDVDIIYLESDPKILIIDGQKFDYVSAILLLGTTILMYPYVIKILMEKNPNWLNDARLFFDKLF